MIVLTVDVGGNNVKVRTSAHDERRKTPSGDTMTPAEMVAAVHEMTSDWTYDVVTIGFPGAVRRDQVVREPYNLGTGWTTFDFHAAFPCPVRIINDAAMQALGSYHGDTMLFMGLGTGLGTAMIIDHIIQPLEIAHLPYRNDMSYEDYLGDDGLDHLGEKKWKKHLWHVVDLFKAALQPDYIVIGGGNSKRLETLPDGVERGDNANAFLGGFRLWQPPYSPIPGPTP